MKISKANSEPTTATRENLAETRTTAWLSPG